MRELRKGSAYRIVAGQTRLQIEFDENFFNNEILEGGTSLTDLNIETILQEVRAVLYYIATKSLSEQ